MNDGNSCMCLLKQKIQTELSGHEEALEEIKKKNEEKDPSHRIMGQIDLTQVHTHTHAHTHVEIHTWTPTTTHRPPQLHIDPHTYT